MPKNSPATSAIDSWPEQLAVKVARCYYELGMTQQDIASLLGIGRARVIRLLAEARERGVVSISINSPLLENVELEEALVAGFGLESAHVALAHADDEVQLAHQVAASACETIRTHIRDSMIIGLGWGITMKEFVDQFERMPCSDISVVSLLGSLTRRSSVMRYEATTEFASRLNAECLYLPAPIVCDSARTRQLLIHQPQFVEIHARAMQADMAIVSIGGLDSSTIRRAGLVSDEDFSSVSSAGAIGNFLGYYIDDDAQIINHSINERIIGIPGVEFKVIPRRFMLSAGKSKVRALAAVLNQGMVTDLVTDQQTAIEVLAVSS